MPPVNSNEKRNSHSSRNLDQTSITDPAKIRQYCRSIRGCLELEYNQDMKVISFLKRNRRVKVPFLTHENSMGTTRPTSNFTFKEDIARINIYYDSMNVGICRFLNGEVREIFRKYSSIKSLLNLLKRPPYLTYFDCRTLELNGPYNDDGDSDGNLDDTVDDILSRQILDNPENAHYGATTKLAHPTSFTSQANFNTSYYTSTYEPENKYKQIKRNLKQKLEIGGIGIAILCAEKDVLQERIRSFQYAKQTREELDLYYDNENHHNADSTHGPTSLVSIGTVTNFLLQLSVKTMTHVKHLLQTDEYESNVISVATNGVGTVVLYKYGNSAFTPFIPPKLKEKLDVRKRTHVPKPPVYVSIGTKNRFYIKLNNGDHYWVGCSAMSKTLKESKHEVVSVAFGKKWKSYFVVFEDGSWEYGDEIPKGLQQLLFDRDESEDLTCVTLGPKEEWFLRTRKGTVLWGGLSDQLETRIAPIHDRILFMDFGLSESYIIQYT